MGVDAVGFEEAVVVPAVGLVSASYQVDRRQDEAWYTDGRGMG